jgi:DNA-binding HxlR family transcriptional regulator
MGEAGMKKEPYKCGLEAALAVIGGKWKTLILWNLSGQTRRFGELRRLVTGVSEKMLIQKLKEMEQDGIITRKVFREVPPRVEYSVTKFGIELTEALGPLCRWGGKHMKRISELPVHKTSPKN